MRSYLAAAILAGAVVVAPVIAGFAPALSKSPFTITNDPVPGTVSDIMQQRTCTGTIVPIWGWAYAQWQVRATFIRNPDGTKWVSLYYKGKGPISLPVTELGVSAQFTTPPEKINQLYIHTTYALWPDGDNRLSGQVVDPYGSIDLTCQ
jgi:hypothetical protein